MSLQSVQPTFDIWGLGVQATAKIFEILRACSDDDIQGIILFPLKNFGAWIAADQDTIANGQDALNQTQTKTIGLLRVIIGLSNRGLSKELAQDIHLTTAFLFVIACSTCLSVEQTGKLMYQMMVLRKPQTADMINSLAVSKFVRNVTGYGDLLSEDDPSQLYSIIQRLVRERRPQQDAFPRLEDYPVDEQVAKLLHNIFDSLENMEYKHITLEGCRNGLLVATLLLWLRKNDTDLSVDGFRVYPDKGLPMARLSINLIRPTDHDGKWKIYKWHPEPHLKSTIDELQLNELFDSGYPCHHYPLGSAKDQMANSGASDQVLDATGHLAAALVDVAFEEGLLCDRGQRSVLPLKDICSQYFVNSYHTIITLFGWEELSHERRSGIADALKSEVAATRAAPGSTDDEVESLRQVIVNCGRRYFDSHGKHILLRGDFETNDVIERAIHIATEAILFSFCLKHPARAMYRPHTTHRLFQNAVILQNLFFRTADDTQPLIKPGGGTNAGRRTNLRIVGYPFWVFRINAMRAMLQGGKDLSTQDLAIACNGYVVYSAALLDIGTNVTDPRRASALCIVPGALRLENKHGRFDRLTEKVNDGVLASSSYNRNPKTVQLFKDSKFFGIDQDDAIDKSGAKIEHLVSTDDDVLNESVISLVTYFRLKPDIEAPPMVGVVYAVHDTTPLNRVPTEAFPRNYAGSIDITTTSWEASINAIVFGTHIRDHNLARIQEEILAQTWKENGCLGQNMQWLLVGKTANPKTRYYAPTTCYDEQLRFFQAGIIPMEDGRRVFIRQLDVPLMQCIKEAMEACGNNSKWVIIS